MVPSWDLMDLVARLTWITCRPAARAPKGPSQQFGTLPSTCVAGDSQLPEGAPQMLSCFQLLVVDAADL